MTSVGGQEPGWERELARWLEEAEGIGDAAASAWKTSPAEAALSLLLAAAESSLTRQVLREPVTVLPAALRAFVRLLSHRLAASCAQVLVQEQRALTATARMLGGNAPNLDPSPAAWRERFESHPALARLMISRMLDWRAYVGELLSRLTADSAALSESFFQGRALTALADLQGDLGDLHEGGRSVAVLHFEGGARVVYKPKDLRITRGVQELCAFLNARSPPLALHVRTVLCREGHAWEEFVPSAPCHSSAEVERFYFRMGMLVRLFQVLEARDLWLDNLVAAGEHPVFVDLEMVLQPRPRVSGERPVLRLARERLEESVAPLGILAAPVALAGGGLAEDVGALTAPRTFQSPVRYDPELSALLGTSRTSAEGQALFQRDTHAPTLAGEPARAVEHLDSLLAGYRALHAVLRANARALLAPEGPLARLAGLPVRYIHRDTWTCYRYTQASLAPSLLVRPELREQALQRLLLSMEAHPEDAAVQAAARAERDALLRGDIPYFLCATDGRALLGPGGVPLHEDFFEGDALTRAQARVRELESFPLCRHEALLRSTLATGRHAPSPPAPRVLRELPEPDWRAEAVAVGDLLLDEALSRGGALAWVGVTCEPLHALWRVDVLPPDMLTGSAGLALVFADLYRVSHHERFRAATVGALQATLDALPASFSQPLEVGAFRGLGASLYTLHRCARALDMPEWSALARRHLASLSLESLLERAPLDVVSGLTGLLWVLLACEELAAARLVVKVLERRLAADAGPASVPTPPVPRGLPSLAEGLARGAIQVREFLGFTPAWNLPPRVATAPRPSSGGACLERIEWALAASDLLQARKEGRILFASRREWGRWFPERLEAEAQELSALWGLGAVAHALLRLDTPGVGSLRLIASVREAAG